MEALFQPECTAGSTGGLRRRRGWRTWMNWVSSVSLLVEASTASGGRTTVRSWWWCRQRSVSVTTATCQRRTAAEMARLAGNPSASANREAMKGRRPCP